jgi:glutaminase
MSPTIRTLSAVACLSAAAMAFSPAALGQSPARPPASSQDPSASKSPDTEAIRSAAKKAFKDNKNETDGKNADYIPALAKVDPRLFGIAVVTVDGRVISVGDVNHPFSIQSVSKPFIAAKLMSEMGPEELEEKIGVNATGAAFNSIEAIERNKSAEDPPPANPLVNAGAIATVGNLQAGSKEERWNKVMGTLNDFAGRKLTVDEEVYKSEAETNTRNRSIADLLKAYEVIPGDPAEALDVYTKQCSVAVTAKDMAVMGATLAAGGVNPITRRQVVSPEIAAKTLAVMTTAGLYEDSGAWSFNVGVPAKSGVGGGIVAVVPGQYAIAVFSPPLDDAGNSVRAQNAIESVVKDIGGNLFMAPQKPKTVSQR